MIRSEPGTAAVLSLVGSEQEDRDGDEHHREAHLSAHQDVATPQSWPPWIGGADTLESADQIGARGFPCRHQARAHGAERGDDESDKQDAIIQIVGQLQRHFGWQLDAPQNDDDCGREQQSQRASADR